PQSAGLEPPFASVEAVEGMQGFDLDTQPEPSAGAVSIPGFEELWSRAEGDRVGLERAELVQVLRAVGAKYNYGLPPAAYASPAQVEAFYRALQLRELALAHAR